MMKLESDKHVVREGSCKECVRCLRLYLCDAAHCGGMSVWKTWLDSPCVLHETTILTSQMSFIYTLSQKTCHYIFAQKFY